MPSNKNRLYVALYQSGISGDEERKYHWGFLIGPKIERSGEIPGEQHHVKNDATKWFYEKNNLKDVRSTINLLARILIAKIEDDNLLVHILQSIPVVQGDSEWRCRTWMANALAEIARNGRRAVGMSHLDWLDVEASARKYVAQKTRDGRYGDIAIITLPKPTFDLIEKKGDHKLVRGGLDSFHHDIYALLVHEGIVDSWDRDRSVDGDELHCRHLTRVYIVHCLHNVIF